MTLLVEVTRIFHMYGNFLCMMYVGYDICTYMHSYAVNSWWEVGGSCFICHDTYSQISTFCMCMYMRVCMYMFACVFLYTCVLWPCIQMCAWRIPVHICPSGYLSKCARPPVVHDSIQSASWKHINTFSTKLGQTFWGATEAWGMEHPWHVCAISCVYLCVQDMCVHRMRTSCGIWSSLLVTMKSCGTWWWVFSSSPRVSRHS